MPEPTRDLGATSAIVKKERNRDWHGGICATLDCGHLVMLWTEDEQGLERWTCRLCRQ